jgi:acetyl/propionyl-CoA carboxylase alpha subunit
MLAKLIVHAPNRDHAIARLRYALEETVILGLGTNQNYLRSLIDHPMVKAGRVHTGFLAEAFGDFAPALSEAELALIAATRAERLGTRAAPVAGTGGSQAIPSPFMAFRGQK